MLTHPIDTIQMVAQTHHAEAALRCAVENRIAEHIPGNGSISYADLAVKASVDEDQTRRILRLLISQHIFSETSTGLLSHSPASLQLLDPGMRAWILYQTEDSLKASTHLSEALAKWPASSHKSETAYNLAHETELSMFEHMSQNGRIGRFREAMSGNAKQPSFDTQHAVVGYPWQDLVDSQPEGQRALVVDVGGGIGHVASAISSSFPALDVHVQDYGVTQPSIKDDIHFSHYDFFTSQPIQGASVYFLRQILHDWSDEYAIQILRNQIAAMGSHSKLVLMDVVLQAPGQWTLSEERKSRMADVTMMTLFNAKEREMGEWLELVKRASEGRLAMTRVERPVGSLFSIMEFSFAV
jgi:6-hydroxytryprostatin B O-methyltransferase